ncbi:MAG TPA: phosphatase RsbU N-terminal domain-containing protein, partial [Steroidobacteraceae bacterium]|nr:phosphatase RsbU N-terminal domain-containing protein [Steroidobacteraceae bacterium]
MHAVRPKPEAAASLEGRYREALKHYLERAGEPELTRAYELGRDALAQGRSIPDLVGIHGEGLQSLLASRDRRRGRDALLGPASAFLAEALAPFEMTHRGYRDSLTAWRHINETLEQEIKRIAHALHDESGQLLVSVHLQLAQLARALPAASQHVSACQTLLAGVERQLRNLSHELRPVVLDDLGWHAAIEFLAAGVSGRARIPIEVRSSVT